MTGSKTGSIEKAMRNNNIVIIIAVTIIITGVYALIKMPRNEFPTFTIRQGVIVGVYPGATSGEVEHQLTREVENYIFGYREVKKAKTYSYSRDGMMYIFVELNDDVKNADQFWSKLKHGLSELKMTLPSGVMAIIANADFGDTSALLITLSSESESYKELEEQLSRLESECRKIPATSKIKHFGLQKEKIFVTVKPELLNEYNIKSLSLLGSFQGNGMTSYGGKIDDGRYVMPVHFPNSFESEKDLAEQIVYSDPNGNVVRLKNIATIERRYGEPDNYIKQNGKKTVLLSLEMQPGNNIVRYGKDVDKALEEFQRHCPENIEVAKISELPKYVNDSIRNFMREFIIAIVAVILVTILLLPFRVASVAGITVPVSVMISLAILYFLGVELHTVSLATLILVLGMIVDNSIVVIDNHLEKIDQGLSPWHAAIASARELVSPIIAATLAIMASYIPLGFMVPGTAGEFMETIPIVVTVTLLVSILVATLLVPYLNFVFIKKGLKQKKKSRRSLLDILQSWYDQALEKSFRHPVRVILAGVMTLVLAVVLFLNTDQQLFPEMERNQFAVEVYLPTGTSLKSTQKVVDSLENILMKDERVINVTSFIGTSSPRFHTVYAPQMPASNYGQILINTVSEKATRAIVADYEPFYSDCFANAHVKWRILAMQASSAPIEIRISSDSINDIREVEKQINSIIAETDGTAWVRTDWNQPQQLIDVNLERDKANRMGLYKGLVATSLMAGLDGLPLTTIWENDYPVDVILKKDISEDKDIDALKNQYVSSPVTLSSTPLRSVATFTPSWSEGTIAHRNGIPTLTIQIDNASGAVASAILVELQERIAKMDLPDGTSVSYGGDYEAMKEVFIPMGIALGVSLLLIFFILLIQFRKQKIALLIMSSILMTLPGAAIGLKVMGYSFSITAFLGITSLCGMVVRNGIILIDYARELREREKLTVAEAALAAGKRRMRPIFLTSAAAGVGVIPMIISRSPLWGPLGTVICFGLLFSMILALFILPVLYSLSYNDKKKKKGFWSVPEGRKALGVLILILTVAGTNSLNAQEYSLDRCRQLTLENNNKIKMADMDLQAAHEQRKEAFTSFFPAVSASGMAMRSADYLINVTTPEMNLPVWDGIDQSLLQNPALMTYIPAMQFGLLDYANIASVSVTAPLYAGGRIRNGNKLAKLGEEISSCQKEMTTGEMLMKTEELYWTLQSLTEKEKTIQSYMTMLDTLCRDVTGYVEAGLTQKNDLLQVQLKQNELKTNMLKLKNGIRLTKWALCQHIGIQYDSTVVFAKIGHFPEPALMFSDPALMVENRSEVQLLDKAVEAQILQKKMITGEYMPQVALVGTAHTYDAMEQTNSNAMAMLSLSIPISDWWGGGHKIKKQNIELEKARQLADDNRELMIMQIQKAEDEINETLYLIEMTRLSIVQAEENMRVTHDNYKAGITGVSDLLEAQAVCQQAHDDLTDALCRLQIKTAEYKQVTGTY